MACLSDITAWASGGKGGGRTLFPFPGAFIASRKLKQPNTLSELDSFLQRQQFNDCVICNGWHISIHSNVQHIESQLRQSLAGISNSRLSLLPFPRPPFSLIPCSETWLLSLVDLGMFMVRVCNLLLLIVFNLPDSDGGCLEERTNRTPNPPTCNVQIIRIFNALLFL